MDKKNILTYEGLKKLEDELEDLKVVKRKEVSQKIKEAREQGDLSENAEYDAAKDEQRDIEARIEELEKILKNAEVFVEEEDTGRRVRVQDTFHSQIIKRVEHERLRTPLHADRRRRINGGKAWQSRIITSSRTSTSCSRFVMISYTNCRRTERTRSSSLSMM